MNDKERRAQSIHIVNYYEAAWLGRNARMFIHVARPCPCCGVVQYKLAELGSITDNEWRCNRCYFVGLRSDQTFPEDVKMRGEEER